jgi:hypothetical protein
LHLMQTEDCSAKRTQNLQAVWARLTWRHAKAHPPPSILLGRTPRCRHVYATDPRNPRSVRLRGFSPELPLSLSHHSPAFLPLGHANHFLGFDSLIFLLIGSFMFSNIVHHRVHAARFSNRGVFQGSCAV